MHKTLFAVAVAALLVAGCETTPEDTGTASGGGETGMAAAAEPAQPEPTTVEPIQPPDEATPNERLVEVGDRVFFDFDRHNVRPDGQATLRRQADLLLTHPGLTITISGHCDERGTREYNLALGERRALAAKNFLVNAGIDAERIETISYGKEKPIVLGHTKTAWAQNRVAITTLN